LEAKDLFKATNVCAHLLGPDGQTVLITSSKRKTQEPVWDERKYNITVLLLFFLIGFFDFPCLLLYFFHFN